MPHDQAAWPGTPAAQRISGWACIHTTIQWMGKPHSLEIVFEVSSIMFYVAIGLGNVDTYEDPNTGFCMSNNLPPPSPLPHTPKNQRAMLVACLLMSCCYLIETTMLKSARVVSVMLHVVIGLGNAGYTH